MSSGANAPCEEFEGEQQKVHEERGNAEHTYEPDEKAPCSLDSPGPSQGEPAVKHPDIEQEQKVLPIRRRDNESRQVRKEERRRRQNAERLEGQRREFERKCEARRKAEAEAAAAAVAVAGDASCAARAQTPNKGGAGEYSRQGEARPQPQNINEEAPRPQPRREQQSQSPGGESMIQCEDRVRSKRGKKPRAVAEGNDQKADTENDTATFLEHGAGAPCRTITDREEHPLMPHPTSAASVASPLTLLRESSSLALEYSDPCGACEDHQTSRESDYLFDPPKRWTIVRALTPMESVQTRKDASDVLFEPPHERSGSSAGTPQVKICHVRLLTDHPPNVDVSRSTHEPQRRRGRGRGHIWRGRGGRGPRDEIS